MIDGRIHPTLVPPTERNRGNLKSYLMKSQIFDTSFFSNNSVVDEIINEVTPSSCSLGINDGGIKTRSITPFLPLPLPHKCDQIGFESKLSNEEKILITLIKNKVNLCQVIFFYFLVYSTFTFSISFLILYLYF